MQLENTKKKISNTRKIDSYLTKVATNGKPDISPVECIRYIRLHICLSNKMNTDKIKNNQSYTPVRNNPMVQAVQIFSTIGVKLSLLLVMSSRKRKFISN